MKATLLLLLTLVLTGSVAADEIAVTVYNSNLGVVSETRQLEFEKGVNRLVFRDVPSSIDPASVRFEVPGKNVSILEQNYGFDLISPEKMYLKYIDEEIELVDQDGRLYGGILLASSSNAVTLQQQDGRIKIVLLKNIAEVSFPELPEGLITRPTLFWLYSSDAVGNLDCKIGYQTSGLNWSAEYVGLLSSDDKELDMSGWSSINNNSGKTYKDARLKLVAGEIGRAMPPPRMAMKGMALDAFAGAETFEEKAFFEYHLYTLPRRTTLADKEIKQISLFDPARTSVEKILTYRPDHHPTNVEVAVQFVNSTASGLGLPLPAGRVRVFKADEDGSMILLGEDRIKHIPRDEEVTLKVGIAFDIVAEERLMDQVRVSKQVEDRNYEIEIRNRKATDEVVQVKKKFYGFWKILDASIEYTKKDANTVIFDIPIKSGEVLVLKYMVRFGAN